MKKVFVTAFIALGLSFVSAQQAGVNTSINVEKQNAPTEQVGKLTEEVSTTAEATVDEVSKTAEVTADEVSKTAEVTTAEASKNTDLKVEGSVSAEQKPRKKQDKKSK